MIPFFRKIRKDLLANSQFFKYSRYAIGEILLIVIGILLALYLNNLNEQNNIKHDQVRILVHSDAVPGRPVEEVTLGALLGLTVFLLDWNKEVTGWNVPGLMAGFYLFAICSVM